MGFVLRYIGVLGFIPAFITMWIIKWTFSPREWATGNDSSLVAFFLLSEFFGVIVLVAIVTSILFFIL